MQLEPTEEQRQLHDSVTRLLARHCSFEQRRAVAATPEGRSPALWQELAALGVTAVLVPEAQGGLGGRLEDMMPVIQAGGSALLTEPVLGSAVLAPAALRHAAGDAKVAALLQDLAAGRRTAAWAHDERPDGGAAPSAAVTRATGHPGRWELTGRKFNVLHAASADVLLVTAQVDGASSAPHGPALFLVEAGTAGVHRRDHRLVDDTPASEVTLAAAAAHPLADPHDAQRQRLIIGAAQAAGTAALCCDMLGAAQRAWKLAVDYLGVRQQFGRLIGENQALRHKIADMLVSVETCHSMAIAAVVAADRPDAEDSAVDLARAKLVVGRHARRVCEDAIQCHGGIGMTEEHAVGHCLRRVHVADHLFGDAHAQAARLAAALD